MDSIRAATPARRLGGALEPVIGSVYFSPQCHQRYADLGFAHSPGDMDGVALPDGPAYFTSRGSVLGQVPGQLVASAFGVFNPEVVIPSVDHGWALTDAATICAARDAGALEQLDRLLGPAPEGLGEVVKPLRRADEAIAYEGRPLTAGLMALEVPDHPLGEVWRLGDRLREFRGDSHTAAWISAGLTAIEIGLLTELYWGLPLRSYSRTRGWTDDQYDETEASLAQRGLISDATFTDQGRALREEIEAATDTQMSAVIDAMGRDFDRLVEVFASWSEAIRRGKGYPASGPHELAEQARRS